MDSPIKVCITIKSLADGGAEKQSLLLAQVLQNRYDTYLAIISPEPKTPKHVESIHRAHLPHIFLQGNLLTRFLQFRRFLSQHHIDLVLSFLPGDTLFGALAKRVGAVTYALGGIRNTQPEITQHKLVTLRYLHNHLLDYSISNSYSGAAECAQLGFCPDKLRVIPNGIVCQPTVYIRADRELITITTIGRFVPQKDYHTALKSIACLLQDDRINTQIRYWIIGYGPLEAQIRQWIQEYQLQTTVDLLISPANIPDLLRQADIYLCSSTQGEGLSNAVMEAMSHSLPIVATDVGDNAQLVTDQVNGYLVPPQDAGAIATGLSQLVCSPTQRLEFGHKNYQLMRDHYSTKCLEQNYVDLIEDLTQNHPPARAFKKSQIF